MGMTLVKIINIIVLKNKKDEIIDIYVEYENRIERAYTSDKISFYLNLFSVQENKSIQELYNEDKIFDVKYSPKLLKSIEKLRNKYNNNQSLTLRENIKTYSETFNTLIWFMTRNLIVNDFYVSCISNLLLVLNACLVTDSISKSNCFDLFLAKKIKKAETKLDLLKYYGSLLLLSSSIIFFKDDVNNYLNQDYYESIMNTDLDNLYEDTQSNAEIRYLKIEKIFNELDNNPYLSTEDKEILKKLKVYYINNQYLDLDELYKKMLTFKIKDYYVVLEDSAAVYLDKDNISEVYHPLDKESSINRTTTILHEAIHMTGGFEYRVLNEGMTSLLEHEYFEEESFYGVDVYFFVIQCIRSLCYLVCPDVLLKAYSESNQKLLDAKMLEIYGSMDKILKIYSYMDLYTKDENVDKELYHLLCDGNLTEEQKLTIPNYIFLIDVTEEVCIGKFFNTEDTVKKLKY